MHAGGESLFGVRTHDLILPSQRLVAAGPWSLRSHPWSHPVRECNLPLYTTLRNEERGTPASSLSALDTRFLAAAWFLGILRGPGRIHLSDKRSLILGSAHPPA